MRRNYVVTNRTCCLIGCFDKKKKLFFTRVIEEDNRFTVLEMPEDIIRRSQRYYEEDQTLCLDVLRNKGYTIRLAVLVSYVDGLIFIKLKQSKLKYDVIYVSLQALYFVRVGQNKNQIVFKGGKTIVVTQSKNMIYKQKQLCSLILGVLDDERGRSV